MVTRFLLAEAQRRHRPVAEGIQTADFQRLLDLFPDLRFRQAGALQTQRHFVVDHGLGDHLVRVLHHVADVLGAAADVLPGQRVSVQEDLTRIRRLEAADELGQRGFARAVPAHDADHLALADGEADMLQGWLALLVAKAQIPHFQQGDRGRRRFRLRVGGEPLLQCRRIGLVQHKAVHMGRALFRRDGHARIPQRREVERLADTVFGQQRSGKQFIRAQVGQNLPLVDEDDAVHVPPEHIFQPVLDDEHSGVGLLLDFVDQLNGLFAGSGVEVGQRLIEEEDLDLIYHDARKADPLLLPAGKLVGRIAEVVLNSHQLGGAAGDGVHLVLRHTAVFQRKGDILAHRQADELAVRVLQDGAHMGRQLKDAAVGGVHAVHGQGAGALAGVCEGVQPVDAARQRAFAAAGGARNEHPLTGVDVQIDAGQRRALLGAVLERKFWNDIMGSLRSAMGTLPQLFKQKMPFLRDGRRKGCGFHPKIHS